MLQKMIQIIVFMDYYLMIAFYADCAKLTYVTRTAVILEFLRIIVFKK